MLTDSRPTTPSDAPARGYWACQVGGWSLYSVLQLGAAVVLVRVPWWQAALELLALNGTGLALTHALHAHIRRHGWAALGIGRRVPRIAGASVLLGLPLALVTPLASVSRLQDSAQFIHQVYPSLARFGGPLSVAHQWANWTTLFAIWQILYFVILSIRRSQQAQLRQSELIRSLQQAELRLLKAQINPHFLFNALNTVRALIPDHPQAAQVAVTRFANTLRYALGAGQHETVPLGRELEIVQDYLDVEALRFEDRLSVGYEVSEAAAGVGIPTMLLQGLVENAVKHGIAELPRGGHIQVEAAVRDGALGLQVSNSRPAGEAVADGGTGLHNSRERLRLIFGARASITLDLSRPDVAVARVRIPVDP